MSEESFRKKLFMVESDSLDQLERALETRGCLVRAYLLSGPLFKESRGLKCFRGEWDV